MQHLLHTSLLLYHESLMMALNKNVMDKYIKLLLKLQNNCGVLPNNQDKHILNVLFAKYLARAIIQRIFFRRIKGYIVIAMTSDDMGRKFKSVERENIFSEMIFYFHGGEKKINP